MTFSWLSSSPDWSAENAWATPLATAKPAAGRSPHVLGTGLASVVDNLGARPRRGLPAEPAIESHE